MTRKARANRHLSWQFLKERIASGTPSREQVEGKPACDLLVEAGGTRLELRINAPREENEALPFFSSVECMRLGTGSRSYVQLSCTDRQRFQEFYGFVTAVADRVQLQDMRVDEAIEDAAASVRELLAIGSAMPVERQIGLWGELWALNQFAQNAFGKLDWRAAVESWTANWPSTEEHDFALRRVDVEVKTTASERRHHHISSPRQLTPKHGRKLFVLSVQLTPGGASGKTLSALVETTRMEITKSVSGRFESTLKASGWKDADADRYSTRWALRSEPRIIEASLFPTLRVEGDTARLVDFSYVVNATDLGSPLEGNWSWTK